MFASFLSNKDLTVFSRSFNYTYYNKNIEVAAVVKKKKEVLLVYVSQKSSSIFLDISYIFFVNYWFLFLLKYILYSSKYVFTLGIIGSVISKFFVSFLEFMSLIIKNFNGGWYGFLLLIGLGFKVFFHKLFLFFRLGFCRIVSTKIPISINFILRRRDRVFFSASNKVILGNFIAFLKHFKLFNIYKAKGFFDLFNFSIIPIKKGKQQQLF